MHKFGGYSESCWRLMTSWKGLKGMGGWGLGIRSLLLAHWTAGQQVEGLIMHQRQMNGVSGHDSALVSILGRGQPGLMKKFLV